MTEQELISLINDGESQTIELTAKPNPEMGKSIVAFANTNDGAIVIGVSDDKKILGCSQKDEQSIANIAHDCKPSIYPEIERIESKGKLVFVVRVKKSGSGVDYAHKNVVYKRIGTCDKPMSPKEVVDFARSSGLIRFDSNICERATLSDIDPKKIEWFLKKAQYERKFDVDPKIPVREALERLELFVEGKLTNAAVLLFGRTPQKFFSLAETRCARFKGIEPIEFIDMKVFGGTIIEQRDDAVEFVKEHIALHAKIVGTERQEKWEYPIEAVREAVTNALCHRDYEISSNVQVRIFDDRVEVWGCGPLPEPLTIADLKRQHESILRNRLIGKCFFLIKFIEQWGTGTNRIIRECKNHGLPEPLFELVTESLVVNFRKYRVSEQDLENLNARQRKAIEYLLKHKKITNKEYREIYPGITDRTALNDLNDLIKKRIIVAEGKTRDRHYVLR
jgi:ATP-dependent DNA helicase RecG